MPNLVGYTDRLTCCSSACNVGGTIRCDCWQKQTIVFEHHLHACRKVCDSKKGKHICISSISVSDTWLGARDKRGFLPDPIKRRHKYHSLSEYALKEDPMKHHCLIILLADMGYFSIVGHGHKPTHISNKLNTAIAIITTSVSVAYITFFEYPRVTKCESMQE